MRFLGCARRGWGKILAVAALLLLSAGCSWTIRQFMGAPAPFPAPVVEEPKIRPGISLKITVMSAGRAEDQAVTVSQAGTVTLPLINAVKCDGLTLQECQEKLKSVYAEFMQNPQITVQLLYGGADMLSPWGTVLVMGKIGREGPINIPPTCDLTITRALQLAGGIAAFGDQTRVKITRQMKDGSKREIEVDVAEIGEKGKRENDYVLQAGDVLWVPEM